MAKKEKRFNVGLFIVLLLLTGVIPGVIYGIVGAIRAYRKKKGIVNPDGFAAKITGGIIGLVFSIIIALCFWGEDIGTFICVGVAGVVLILLAILNKKTKKKIFNLLYLVALVIYFVLPLPIMMVQIAIGIFLAIPTTIGSVFGIVGVIRDFKS